VPDIFSTELAVATAAVSGPFNVVLDLGHTGRTLSILYMTIECDDTPGFLGKGFKLTDVAGKIVWRLQHPEFLLGHSYQWHGREVATSGDTWVLDALSAPLDLRVVGFAFSS